MKIPNKINTFRRFIMRHLTNNIGKSEPALAKEEKANIKRILISRPNSRLGNLLLITPLVQEVIHTFPDCEIDLFVKGKSANKIFRNYENIHHLIQLPQKPFSNLLTYIGGWIALRARKYDLVINVSQNSSSGKLSTRWANARLKFFCEFNEDFEKKYPDYLHMAKFPVYNFRNHISQMGLPVNNDHVPLMRIRLDEDEIEDGRMTLAKIVKNDKKTICLFTYATGAKCYSESWWSAFYAKLKAAFPNYNIIEILPVENISRLGYKIPVFYSKNIREIGAVLAGADLFIGADSGMMHLASAAGTPTIALFSVTPDHIYKPYNKNSRAINTNYINQTESLYIIKNLLQYNSLRAM